MYFIRAFDYFPLSDAPGQGDSSKGTCSTNSTVQIQRSLGNSKFVSKSGTAVTLFTVR